MNIRWSYKFIFICCMGILLQCENPGLPEYRTGFDWQGHRGARGLSPENTVPAFLKALAYPVQTLELDVVVSADSQVLVSHEPWLSHRICKLPPGAEVLTEDTERRLGNIYQMPYAAIRECDCGSRGNPDFPRQAKQPAYKPLLSEVFTAVRDHCMATGRPLPGFNIEIKSRPDWDSVFTPDPGLFAALLIEEIRRWQLNTPVTIQSFDVRALQAVRQQAPELPLAYLVASADALSEQLSLLGFVPEIYSPYHELVQASLVAESHAQGMRIIPWTVNEQSRMAALVAMGVDGIITDYPDLIW